MKRRQRVQQHLSRALTAPNVLMKLRNELCPAPSKMTGCARPRARTPFVLSSSSMKMPVSSAYVLQSHRIAVTASQTAVVVRAWHRYARADATSCGECQ